jgi:hypothetical protein
MAKEKIQVPLTFELGWQRQGDRDQNTPQAASPRQFSPLGRG